VDESAQAGLPEDLGDARRRDAPADTGQLADDPLVTQRGLSRARRRTSAARAFVAMIDLFTSVSGEPGPDEQVAERKRVAGRLSDPERPVVRALLRLEFGRGIVLLQPQEAVMLRDELQAIDDPSAVRLATQIDVAATMLLAAPRHAGVRAVRVADDERQVLLDVSRKLEYLPGGSFATLHHELSIGE
jgi:hypothetical protein